MDRDQAKRDLVEFLRTIQLPDEPIADDLAEDVDLVDAGLADSLALLQIVDYLEESHGIDFSVHELAPEDLRSLVSILEVVERCS